MVEILKDIIDELVNTISSIDDKRDDYESEDKYFWYLTGKIEAYQHIRAVLYTWREG